MDGSLSQSKQFTQQFVLACNFLVEVISVWRKSQPPEAPWHNCQLFSLFNWLLFLKQTHYILVGCYSCLELWIRWIITYSTELYLHVAMGSCVCLVGFVAIKLFVCFQIKLILSTHNTEIITIFSVNLDNVMLISTKHITAYYLKNTIRSMWTTKHLKLNINISIQ